MFVNALPRLVNNSHQADSHDVLTPLESVPPLVLAFTVATPSRFTTGPSALQPHPHV